jgi:BlaI family transcriptional regulator, penicillinase repressor
VTTPEPRLAELQLAIMQVLWDRGEATVAEVRTALEPDRPLAHTTVGTMLAKMEAKQLVAHTTDGRVNLYRPLVERERVERSMVADLASRLFGGDVSEMVCQLLDGCDVSRAELARMRRLIRDKERELRDDG